MIVSYNWLKKFTQINLSAEALAKEIGSKLVEVESVESLAPKYAGVKIARVKSTEKVDGSDHLTLCKIDDGGISKKLSATRMVWCKWFAVRRTSKQTPILLGLCQVRLCQLPMVQAMNLN